MRALLLSIALLAGCACRQDPPDTVDAARATLVIKNSLTGEMLHAEYGTSDPGRVVRVCEQGQQLLAVEPGEQRLRVLVELRDGRVRQIPIDGTPILVRTYEAARRYQLAVERKGPDAIVGRLTTAEAE